MLYLSSRNTPINTPAPRLIDLVAQCGQETGFIFMTRVQGNRLDDVLYRMTNEERRELGRDLGLCISQRRRCIPNPSNHKVANPLGGPAYDPRFEGRKCGPFDSTKDSLNYIPYGGFGGMSPTMAALSPIREEARILLYPCRLASHRHVCPKGSIIRNYQLGARQI